MAKKYHGKKESVKIDEESYLNGVVKVSI